MDLLLELIKKHEVNVFDIPIALITAEYLDYVDAMTSLDLHVGGEWLELAATLVFIKSKMLLPPEPGAEDDADAGPDPREELVQRLIEYQMYKLMAEKLDERPQLARDVFPAPPRLPEPDATPAPPRLREATLGDLVKALQRVIQKQEEKPNWVYEITREKLTLRQVITDIATMLGEHPRITFEALFEEIARQQRELDRHLVVTTFLALLEMTRLKMIRLFQARLTEDVLYVERAVIDIMEVSQQLDLGPLDS